MFMTGRRMDSVIKTMMLMFSPEAAEASSKNVPDVNEMHRVLLGMRKPGNLISISFKWFDDSLNEGQKEAVRFALSSPEVACIWGPPGS